MTGVSFVVPVHNGATFLRRTIAAIAAQQDGRPLEVLVVEDGSTDDSAAAITALSQEYALRIIEGPRRGAAAAVNAGMRAATHPVICQVDQDVEIEPGWMARLLSALQDPGIAAAQGRYVADGGDSFCARVMSLDLEMRYASLGSESTHVCTGNTAYRADALRAVGWLDEQLGYGYDNDLSYRLQAAGFRLAFCRDARSRHRWRDGLWGYLVQQYGFGYGRLDVVVKHPSKYCGDSVSSLIMMAHPVLLAVALALIGAGALASARFLALTGGSLVGLLLLERASAGVRAWVRFGDRAALAFPLMHLLRDLAWVAAMSIWSIRRLLRASAKPRHSMRARVVSR